MDWMQKLGKDNRGSRPRCVLLCDGEADRVARRLTNLVGRPEIRVSALDRWLPRGTACVHEAELDKAPNVGEALLDAARRRKMRKWWLAGGGARTPKWDIASTCTISDRAGLLLVEAKAHSDELSANDPCGAKLGTPNRESIDNAVAEANDGLRDATGGPWQLCTARKYQLANRFAWSWKLAMLGKPVVLVYLGFLNALEMKRPGTTTIGSDDDWKETLLEYSGNAVDSACWETELDINGTTMLPLIRTANVQDFEPTD